MFGYIPLALQSEQVFGNIFPALQTEQVFGYISLALQSKQVFDFISFASLWGLIVLISRLPKGFNVMLFLALRHQLTLIDM